MGKGGLWQNDKGRFAEVNLRLGRLAGDLDLQDPNQLVASQGSNRTYGQGASVLYGQRLEKQDGWDLEPHAGLYWAHVNGYNYNLSDDSAVSVDGSRSFMAGLGINVGRKAGQGGTFYARLDLLHDFAGGVQATMTKGKALTLENDFKDTWLDVALGYKRQAGPVEWYVEAGRLGIGSKAAQGNWVWNVGLKYKF